MADTYLGDFALNGAQLRRKGINRIGNLLVPNDVSEGLVMQVKESLTLGALLMVLLF
jgi:deoxyhypusine synthase